MKQKIKENFKKRGIDISTSSGLIGKENTERLLSVLESVNGLTVSEQTKMLKSAIYLCELYSQELVCNFNE